MNETFRTVFLSCTLVAVVSLLPLFSQGADWNPLSGTGLTQCYDADGAEINCVASGQDAQYLRTLPSLQKNADQTVTDTNTGLIWLQSAAGIQRTWQDAIAYCDKLVFAGKNDWRLPAKFELESIVDYSRSYPAINEEFDCESSFYWSATAHKPNPPYAWGVYCPDGADHWLHKTNHYYVRCVRDGE